MEPQTQRIIQEAVERFGKDEVVVVLGAVDPASLNVAALTVRDGDPAYVGPLAGVQLGLRVMHIFDKAVRAITDSFVYEEHVGWIKTESDVGVVQTAMTPYRS